MVEQHTHDISDERLICHKCAYIKPPVELVNQGKYRLCLDCSRKFSNLKETGQVNSLADYVIVE